MTNNLNFLPDKSGRLSPEDSKSYFSRIGLTCFILGMISLLISIAAKLLIRDMFPWVANDPIISTVVSYGITIVSLYVLALPLAALALNPLPKTSPIKEKMKPSHILAGLCISFMLTFIGSYISSFILSLTTSDTAVSSTESTLSNISDTEILIHGIFLALFLPILEELVFRKFLCSRILPLGEGYAIFFSSIIFALMGELYQIPHAFMLGLFFSFIYVKTGKVIYSIIFHCAINLYNGVLGIYMTAKLPIDEILEILQKDASEQEIMSMLEKYMGVLQIYLWTSILLIVFIIAGFIICYKAIRKEKFSLQAGIIPPAKKHRVGNVLLASGIAASVGYLAAKIILPMFVERYL